MEKYGKTEKGGSAVEETFLAIAYGVGLEGLRPGDAQSLPSRDLEQEENVHIGSLGWGEVWWRPWWSYRATALRSKWNSSLCVLFRGSLGFWRS